MTTPIARVRARLQYQKGGDVPWCSIAPSDLRLLLELYEAAKCVHPAPSAKARLDCRLCDALAALEREEEE